MTGKVEEMSDDFRSAWRTVGLWLELIAETVIVQTIGQFIQRATMRHSVTAVIRLFPVLQQLRSVKPEFDITLEVC